MFQPVSRPGCPPNSSNDQGRLEASRSTVGWMTARLPNVAKNKNQETGKQSKTSLIHRTKFGIGSVLGFGIHFLLMVRLIRNNNGFLKEIRSQAKQVNQWMWLVIEHGCRGYNINTVLVAAAPTFSRTPEDLSAAAGGWDMPSTRFQFVFFNLLYSHLLNNWLR